MRFEIKRQKTRNSQSRLRVGTRTRCVFGRAVDIAVLQPEQRDELKHPSPEHVCMGRLRHAQHVCQVRIPRAPFIAHSSELFESAFAHALEQPVARWTYAMVHGSQ